jgi:hypothetical protein
MEVHNRELNMMCVCSIQACDLGWVSVVGSCEYDSEISDTVRGRRFPCQMGENYLLNKKSDSLIQRFFLSTRRPTYSE